LGEYVEKRRLIKNNVSKVLSNSSVKMLYSLWGGGYHRKSNLAPHRHHSPKNSSLKGRKGFFSKELIRHQLNVNIIRGRYDLKEDGRTKSPRGCLAHFHRFALKSLDGLKRLLKRGRRLRKAYLD
jgi:hypothetical protein